MGPENNVHRTGAPLSPGAGSSSHGGDIAPESDSSRAIGESSARFSVIVVKVKAKVVQNCKTQVYLLSFARSVFART